MVGHYNNCLLKKNDISYFIGLGLFVFFAILSTSFYYSYFSGSLYNVIKLIVLFLVLYNELNNNWNGSTLLLGVLIVILVFLSLKNGDNVLSEYICGWVILFCSHSIAFKRISNFIAIISIITLAFIVLSAELGIITNFISQRGYLGITRSYLGFRYSLYAPAFYFNIVALRLFYKQERISILELLVLFLGNIYLYLMTDSRLSFYLTIVLLLVGLLSKINFWGVLLKKEIRPMVIGVFFICLMISFGLTLLYDPKISIMRTLNQILVNRLELGKNALNDYGVSLFGQNIQWVGNGLDEEGLQSTLQYNFVDSFYLHVLLKYGALSLGIIMFFYTSVMKYLFDNKDSIGIAIVALIALHGIADNLIMSLHYNTFILLMAPAAIYVFGKHYNSSRLEEMYKQ